MAFTSQTLTRPLPLPDRVMSRIYFLVLSAAIRAAGDDLDHILDLDGSAAKAPGSEIVSSFASRRFNFLEGNDGVERPDYEGDSDDA